MTYTNTPITTASFHNISKQYSRYKADELLIAPHNTTKSKDEWLHCWNIIAKHQHKFPGSLEYLQFYLLGNLQKQLSTAQKKPCILCKGSDETLNHLVEQCWVAKTIWRLLQQQQTNNQHPLPQPTTTTLDCPILTTAHLTALNNFIMLVEKIRNKYRFSTEQKPQITIHNLHSILNTIIIEQQLPVKIIKPSIIG
ncbi:unnamed protein product [Ambrosiozyma monospora]|uniref:Unnamed protein product n=1 Tax=Ambrosiozyma monospora TaxID=43982 RepID=A0A9W6YX75_AMBMO|nr:unnamed protein product [Ambrosiozyma monospora]